MLDEVSGFTAGTPHLGAKVRLKDRGLAKQAPAHSKIKAIFMAGLVK